MAKRKKNNVSLDPKKSKRIEPPEKIKIGLSNNLTPREKKLLDKIVNLVTNEKENPICTSSSSLLSEAGRALFMEYDSETEKLHLWMKSSTGPTIKLLVHPVFTIGTVEASAKRPLISFPENFVDSENWRILKSMLTEIFGEAANDAEENPDFVFVFTRRGDFVHLRIYQVLDVPNSSMLQKRLRLSLCEHICLMSTSFPTIRANQFTTPQTLELFEDNVFIGSSSSNLGQLHSVVVKGSIIHFVLDDVTDLENWRGFSTCLTDFKTRNEPIFSGRLLGCEGAMEDYVNDQYKLVIRSLLVEMVGLHRSNWCFKNISENDICLSETTVKLSWKLELIEYNTIAARYNYKAIRALIAGIKWLWPNHSVHFLNNWQDLIKSNTLLEDVAERMVCVANAGDEAKKEQNEVGPQSGHAFTD